MVFLGPLRSGSVTRCYGAAVPPPLWTSTPPGLLILTLRAPPARSRWELALVRPDGSTRCCGAAARQAWWISTPASLAVLGLWASPATSRWGGGKSTSEQE